MKQKPKDVFNANIHLRLKTDMLVKIDMAVSMDEMIKGRSEFIRGAIYRELARVGIVAKETRVNAQDIKQK